MKRERARRQKCGDIGRGFLAAGAAQCRRSGAGGISTHRRASLLHISEPGNNSVPLQLSASELVPIDPQTFLDFPNITSPPLTSDCQQSMQKIGVFANKCFELHRCAIWLTRGLLGTTWKSPWEGDVIIGQFGRISGSVMTLMG